MYEEGGESEMEAPEPMPGRRRSGLGKFIKPVRQWTGRNDSKLEDIIELIDPTGLSSWDDAAEKIREIGNRKNQGWRKYVSTAGAIMQALPKTRWLMGVDPMDAEAWAKFPKWAKATNYLRGTAGTMIPMTQMIDKNLMPGNKILGPYNYGSKSLTYQQGGPVVGQEMEVSPEQLEELRRMGYEFEIV
jgi:hypothetical protein